MLASDASCHGRQRRDFLRNYSKHSLRLTLPYLTIGYILAVFVIKFLPAAPPLTVENDDISRNLRDPSYTPRPARLCKPPQLHSIDYPETLTCVRILSSTATTLTLELTPSSLQNNNNDKPQSVATVLRSNDMPALTTTHNITEFESPTLIYKAMNLTPCIDYNLIVQTHHEKHPRKRQVCIASRLPTTCLPNGNLIHNPSFEQSAESPYFSTRHATTVDQRFNARQWTPFYDGGAKRICGTNVFPFNGVVPRSGYCTLILGHIHGDRTMMASIHAHYGAHTTIAFGGNDHVSNKSNRMITVLAWFVRRHGNGGTNMKAKAKMVVSWKLKNGRSSDGVSVSLENDDFNNPNYEREGKSDDIGNAKWKPVCLTLESDSTGMTLPFEFSALHIFFHLDAGEGEEVIAEDDMLFIDDVVAFQHDHLSRSKINDVDTKRLCHQAQVEAMPSILRTGRRGKGSVHLRAAVIPESATLTLAVPLTTERILRLETLSKQYGGGPIAAAVAVRNECDVASFTKVWSEKMWLWKHVNVTFVHRQDTDGALAINALRNVAVSSAKTEFVIMLDVDMTPAPDEFSCLRGTQIDNNNKNTYLQQLLPGNTGNGQRNSKKLIAMTVLITDIHQRAARNKKEARDAILEHAGFFYCVNSQRASRLRQWVSTGDDDDEIRQTRFLADYEPYVIGRRDEYPEYDEQFRGYGFNKISWLLKADADGWRIYVLTRAFVTHLNHVENDWVSGIDEERYLQTWRRYLGLVAEVGDFTFGGGGRKGLQRID